MILLSIISGTIIKNSMYNREIKFLSQISSMITESIDKWGDDNLILVEDIASSQVINSNYIDNIRTELKNKQGQDTNILNIMYSDTAGNILADSMGSKNYNISDTEYFKEASQGYTYVSNVITDDDLPYIVFSSPIITDSITTGYIINKVKISGIAESIGNIFYTEKGQVYTYNNNGFITYHNDSNKIMQENILNNSSNLAEGARKALSGNFNNIDYLDNGEHGVAVYNFVPSLNWGTMITSPSSEIYSGFYNVFVSSIPVIIIIICAIIVVALYILRLLTKPISEMASLVKEVSEGNLTIECNLNGSSEISNIGNDLF